MRIGIEWNLFSNFYSRYGEQRYEKLKEHGYDCADFTMCNTDTWIYDEDWESVKEKLLKEKTLADNAGIEFNQCHGPWRCPIKDGTEEDRAERMEKMKRSIKASAVLGCKNWVIHAIMPFGPEHLNAEQSQKTWDMNVEFFAELLKTAKDEGVIICLENLPFEEFPLSLPEDIIKFVKLMNDDNFKMCFDTGHSWVFDLPVGEQVRLCKDYIRVFHIHDNKWHSDQHAIPFYGTIDWDDFSKSLKDIDFNGVFSLEVLPPAKVEDAIFEKIAVSLKEIACQIIN